MTIASNVNVPVDLQPVPAGAAVPALAERPKTLT
jgi:hypothetical protein